MTRSPRRSLFLGLLLGVGLCAGVVAGLYKAGYHLMRHEAPAPAAKEEAKKERKLLCWVSPTDPSFVRDQPGKDDKGQELIPVYDDQFAAAPTPSTPAPAKKERKIKYWVSPMEPNYIRDQPGKAPCGMDLIPVYEDEAEGKAAGTIAVDPNTLQSMGVRTAKVEIRELTRTIRAVGKVTFDERKLEQVNTKVNGWVQRLYAKVTGDPIKKGQPLLSIYSPDLVSSQGEYLLALKHYRTMRESPYPELRESAKRLLEAAERRLEYWDIPESQIGELADTGEVKKDLILMSPVHGIVIKRLVTEGQYVQAGMPLLEVADLSSVWVEADIYEYEMPWVKVGQPAAITLSYIPGQTFHGKVQYLYPYLSGTTRTARIRLAFPNPLLKLKPDMFAQVELKSAMPKPAVAVPAEAVLDTGETQRVFLNLGGGRFEPRQVHVGVESSDGWREITFGLKGGEDIVTSAQFLLDSESRTREAIAKMLQKAPAPGQPPAQPGAPAPPKEAAPPPMPPGHRH